MVEIFNYTERVVNMIRPRKLLFMAIGQSRMQRQCGALLTRPQMVSRPVRR